MLENWGQNPLIKLHSVTTEERWTDTHMNMQTLQGKLWAETARGQWLQKWRMQINLWGKSFTYQVMQLQSKTPSSLASYKSRLVLHCWYWHTQVVLEKVCQTGSTSSLSQSVNFAYKSPKHRRANKAKQYIFQYIILMEPFVTEIKRFSKNFNKYMYCNKN